LIDANVCFAGHAVSKRAHYDDRVITAAVLQRGIQSDQRTEARRPTNISVTKSRSPVKIFRFIFPVWRIDRLAYENRRRVPPPWTDVTQHDGVVRENIAADGFSSRDLGTRLRRRRALFVFVLAREFAIDRTTRNAITSSGDANDDGPNHFARDRFIQRDDRCRRNNRRFRVITVTV